MVPTIFVIDAWTEVQLRYLQWLRAKALEL